MSSGKPFCPDKPDGSISLTVSGGVPAEDYNYLWSDNSTERNLTKIPAGKFTVIIMDNNGCASKESVEVEPANKLCLIIPDAISPNGDGKNDIWNIGNIDLYPNVEILIYNRWGQFLWKSDTGYHHPWDGTSGGDPLPVDGYHWVIDLHNGMKPLMGAVTIYK